MNLLIVESPSKVKKIAKFLGNSWIVEASFGHIRDLPENEIGVEPPNYDPIYEIIERNAKQVSKLRKLAKEADELWLATDPDREGEAIAWHLNELLGHGKIVRRVTFNEITESAVKKAVQNPRKIDHDLFMAQQSRRVLDRLCGYKLSPALSNKLQKKGVSAGRVQSVALRLIVERENNIREFKSTKHYGVVLHFAENGSSWQAKWNTEDFVTKDNPYITERSVAESVLQLATQGLKVVSFEEKEQSRKPPAPLITSTLQQAAANTLRFSVSDTMKAAQKLFEDGHITYMRTDNPNLSEEGITAIHDFLKSAGQEDHIPEKPNTWKAKGGAQEAHEAIRPTQFDIREVDTGDNQADLLYKLIWRVAIACQMKPAIYKVRSAKLETITPINLQNVPNPQEIPAVFLASGREMIYQGWKTLMKDDYTNEDKEESQLLPALKENQIYVLKDGNIVDLETKPPRRYSETSLVKVLEQEDIGRPATYANIIETQLKRGYATLENRVFQPTPLGEAVVNALAGSFAIMDTAYTAEMEGKLDAIAQGRATYFDVVHEFDHSLDSELRNFDSLSVGVFVDENSEPCPACEKGILRRIKGKNGYFWGCSAYKEGCKYVVPDNKGKPGKPIEKSQDFPCPECGTGYLQRRPSKKDKKKFWWGCDQYPTCNFIVSDDNGKPGKPMEKNQDFPCPECGMGYLQRRPNKKDKKKFWWGCDQYPTCKHTAFDDDGKPCEKS